MNKRLEKFSCSRTRAQLVNTVLIFDNKKFSLREVMLQLPCATQYYPIESLTQQKNGRRHALKNRMLKILQLDSNKKGFNSISFVS